MLDNQSTAVAPGPRRFCPVCEQTVGGFEPGPRGRPNARCGKCQSLERHRFIALMLRALAPRVTAAGVLLDIAPSRSVQRLFQGQLRPRRHPHGL
jgi:hypothetical protein